MSKTTPEQLEAVTARVLDAFTSAGMLFTALDVSNSVKQTLPDIRHREVAPIVRDAFSRGSMGPYKQTMIDVIAEGRKAAEAFLYHLPKNPPTDYDDSMRSQLAIPPVAAGAEDDDTTITDKTMDALVKIGVDGRGRVPRGLLKNAGIAGDDVIIKVQAVPPKLEIVQAGTAVTGQTQAVKMDHPSLLHVPDTLIAIFSAAAGPPQLLARVDAKAKTVTIKDLN
jgi:hypothetical protein